jgi:hypothetical protein
MALAPTLPGTEAKGTCKIQIAAYILVCFKKKKQNEESEGFI